MSDNATALKQAMGQHFNPPAELVFKKGSADYVGHADITRILTEVDPLWTWEPAAWGPDGPAIVERHGRLCLWAWMTVLGRRLPCVGTVELRTIEKRLNSPQGPVEVDKELIGDLIRNGAMRFGIALGLWSKADWAEPGLPDSRTPEERQPVAEDYHGWPSKAEHDRWWTEVADMLRSLPAPALNQAISKLTEEDLFVERKPRLPFSREQSKRVGTIVLAEGVAADREPVEVPDDGLEDWQRELALVEDVAAFDWKKAAGKLIPLRPVPLFKMAKEAAARIGADEPHDLGSIDGAVGQELVLALIDLQPPF